MSTAKRTGLRLHVSCLASAVVALALVGYPLVAALTAALGVEGRTISIVLRAVVLGLALMVVLWSFNHKMSHTRWSAVALMLLTMGAYGLRLLSEVLLRPEALGQPTSIYLLFFFGVTLVPTLALLLVRRIDLDLAFRLTFVLTTAATLVAFVLVRQTSLTERIVTQRGALDGLNSISLGHLGVTLALLCLWRLVTTKHAGIAGWLLFVSLLATGLGLTFVAAARGPFIAFAVVVLLMFIVMPSRSRLRLAGSLSLVSLLSGIYIALVIGVEKILAFQRILVISTGNDPSSNIRIELYLEAIKQIYEHPLLGVSIEVPGWRYYPHNVILEYFMATGLFVGWLFVVLIGIVLWRGLGLLRAAVPQAWVYLLFLQSLTGAMFSGSVYANNALWITAALTLYVAQKTRSEPTEKSRSPLLLEWRQT